MKKISNRWLFIFLFALTALNLNLNVFGQQRQPDRGFHSANSYALSDIETINTTNGNLMLNLPIASLPSGRGGSSGYTLALHYNSKLWDAKQESRTNSIPDENGNTNYTVELLKPNYEAGWNLAMYYNLDVTSRNDLEPPVVCTLDQSLNKNAYIWKVRLQFPDGSYHEFKPVGYPEMFEDGFYNISPNGVVGSVTALSVGGSPSCSSGTTQATINGMNYVSVDGSATRLFIPYNSANNGTYNRWTLYFPDGRIIERSPADDASIAQRITDRNGNKTVIKGGFLNGISGTKIEDDAGHFIFITHTSDTVNNTWSDTIYQPGVNGELLQTKIDWQELWVYRKYLATLDANAPLEARRPELFESVGAVSKITLPSQSSSLTYNFTYNADQTRPASGSYTSGWGELSSVTLPSGAKAEYGFNLDGQTDASFITNFDVLNNNITRKDLKYNSEYDNAVTPITETWTYNINSSTSGSITRPDGSASTERFGSGASQGLSYRTENSNGSMVERIWQFNTVQGIAQSSNSGNNSYVKTELSTIPNNAGQPSLTAIKDFKYDKNGNVLEIKEYDWVPFNSIPRQTFGNDPNIGRVTGLPANIQNYLRRTTVNTYYNQATDAGTGGYDANAYTNPGSAKLKNVIKSTEVRNANGTSVSRSEFFYDDANNKGNLTETRSWDSTKQATLQASDSNGYKLTNNNYVNSLIVYDVYGNPTLTTDAKGTQTQITYGNITTPNGIISGLYPTQTVAAYGTSIARTSTGAYDFYTGLVISATDVDNNLTSTTTYDGLGRPIKAASAVGTALEIWTQSAYDDVNRMIIVKSDLETKGDARKVSAQFYDQLGRVRLSKTLENAAVQSAVNETDGIKVQTRYSTSGGYTYQLTSNPYRAIYSTNATNEPEMGWTRSKTINIGNHSETETFAGAILPAPWGNNSNTTGKVQTDIDADRTLVTDQAGKQKVSKTNALAQLTDVWEVKEADGNTEAISFGTLSLTGLKTNYTYDILGNLKFVNQGAQVREFTYSSLSRLLSAQNPESGIFNYRYDDNGNVLQKTDSRGIITAYSYDALNRITSRSYSNEPSNQPSTPSTAYTYDNLPNARGKLTKVSNSISTTEFTSFDKLGRVSAHKQITDGRNFTTQYIYNLSGALVEQTYPSGRVVRNALDADGDLAEVESKKNSSDIFRNYATNFTYTAAGAISSLRLGNGRFENTTYNSRLQPVQIGLGSSATNQNLLKLNFDYGIANNNGNVKSQTITVPTVGNVQGFTAHQTYSYDSLNRLKQAQETINNNQTPSWRQTFNYDRYGNRRFDESNNNTTTLASNCPTAVCNPTIDLATNRLVGYTFDNAGNTKNDAEGRTFIYDGENKQVEVKDAYGNSIGQYFYDGDGRRVKKISLTETTMFIYNTTGQLVAEYSTNISQQAQITYMTTDHLGSPRINTNALGQIISRHDYQPFGEEIPRTNYGGDSVRKKFTGYERDSETNLDYAKARMFGSSLGRFTSPDNFLNSTRPEKPASWNLYVYALNNPLRYTDPSGEVERDENGKVIFHKTGEDKVVGKAEVVRDRTGKEVKINGKTVYARASWTINTGYVKANDGKTEIVASQATSSVNVELVDKNGKLLSFKNDDVAANNQLSQIQESANNLGYDATSDCHGTTFASGQVWINNDQVGKLIKGDGYRQVTGSEEVQQGDVVVYSKDGSLGETQVEHSVTLNADRTKVRSKGGYTKLDENADIGPGAGTAWRNENSKITVWTLRAKSNN